MVFVQQPPGLRTWIPAFAGMTPSVAVPPVIPPTSVIPAKAQNPSEPACDGFCPAAPRLASMDFRLHGKDAICCAAHSGSNQKISSARSVFLAGMILMASSVAIAAHGPQVRNEDSVRRNGEKNLGGKDILTTPPTRANYLLKAVPLRSTFPPKQQSLINFGPFVNNSPYTLVIALNHIGGNSQSGSAGNVDGVQITQSEWATHFEVPPGSQYSFSAISEHQMTAWVVGAFTDDQLKTGNKNQLLMDVGLPNASAFINPTFLPGSYRACALFYRTEYAPMQFDSINNESSSSKVAQPVLKGVAYFYQDMAWSDKSALASAGPQNPWQANFDSPAVAGAGAANLVLGSAQLAALAAGNQNNWEFGPAPTPAPAEKTCIKVVDTVCDSCPQEGG
jgi:hypothetical protein